MKKALAILVIFVLVMCVFTACKKKYEIPGSEMVTDYQGSEIPVVTEENGGVMRNEDGDIVVAFTDQDGKAFTNQDGTPVTSVPSYDTAIVIGNVIEFRNYYITLPSGWSNLSSYTDMSIKKDGTETIIKVMEYKDQTLAQQVTGINNMMNSTKETFPDSVIKNGGIDIGDEGCPLYSCYVPKGANGNPGYYAYALLKRGGILYSFMLMSDHDLEPELDEISGILSSIKFKH